MRFSKILVLAIALSLGILLSKEWKAPILLVLGLILIFWAAWAVLTIRSEIRSSRKA